MRTKKIEKRFEETLGYITALSNRVKDLEQKERIEISRPLSKTEIKEIEKSYYPSNVQPMYDHVDTFSPKDIILLLLDHLSLELKNTPGKIQLIKLQNKKGEKK